ncbi:MAG: dockerin type I repeat-containing protein [Clostridia bacterium]|nr:dockerin type I repeat-containing protein [Clostridia bacterium]
MKSHILRKSLALFVALCLCVPVLAGYTVSAQNTESSKILSIDFSKINESNKNLITKQAYPGGSTFSFDAYVPAGGSWWGVLWTTDPAVGDIYNHSSGHIFGAKADQWANYSWTLPDDGQNYYLYFVGELNSVWADKPVLVDNFTICDASDNVIAFDGFNTLLNAGLFRANANAVSLIDYDYHAVLDVDHINSSDNSQMSLITKEAYPGGSIVTFDAYVPAGGSWWGLCWTTNPSVNSIYNGWSSGTIFATEADAWATYSATLPNDDNNYYLYFVGAVGEWGGKTIELNNVEIKAASGTVLATEGFDNGARNCIFNYDSAVAVIGGEVETANTYVAINIDNICSDDNHPMSFVTKQAYAGGSTVNFDAFVPSGASWWGLCWTTNPNVTSIYNCWSLGTTFATKADQWAGYTATLPEGGNYYLYFVGAVGEWGGKELLIDNVVINSPAGATLAAEEFSAGLGNSIFNYVKTNTSDLPVVTEVVEGQSASADYAASINIDGICSADNGQMSFITKKAYPGGSTVNFDAYVPSGTSWWGMCWTTDANVNSIYNCWSLGRTFSTQNDTWATYTATLPDDGNDYYFYIVGAVGEWNGQEMMVDNVTVTGANGYMLGEEDFSGGLKNSIFVTDGAVSMVNLTPEEIEATCGDLNDDGTINVVDLVILKKYLAGTRTLDAVGTVAADVDEDGEISSADVVALKSIILYGVNFTPAA